MQRQMTAVEIDQTEMKDLIESMVPPERLIGRSVDLIAAVVLAKKYVAWINEESFDERTAIWETIGLP